MEVVEKTITPEIASSYLARNDMNRNVSQEVVDRYANDMSRDMWQLNGDTIRIATSGRLLDGQHRLLACVKSKRPFRTLVATNIDDNSFLTIDTGRKRTAGDTLSINGITNSNAVAAAVRWIAALNSKNYVRRQELTSADVVAYVTEHPEIVSATQLWIHKVRTSGILSTPMVVSLFSVFRLIDEDLATVFFEKLLSGEGLTAKDPVFLLRERIIKDRLSVSKTKRLHPWEVAALAIRAWNSARISREMFSLRGQVKSRTTGENVFPDAI